MKLFTLPSIRINNFKKDTYKKIESYWIKYRELELNKKTIYAFYYNYESNYKGDYDFAISGYDNFTLPSILTKNKYKIFTCTQSTLIEKWQEIWSLEDQSKINRAYDIDFEKYYEDGSIEIYISIQ